jgi:hypothetical protein
MSLKLSMREDFLNHMIIEVHASPHLLVKKIKFLKVKMKMFHVKQMKKKYKMNCIFSYKKGMFLKTCPFIYK